MVKVLMFGWEFPPFFAGGVGIVCRELVNELIKRDDVSVTFVMPFGPKEVGEQGLRLLIADNYEAKNKISLRRIPSLLGAYITQEQYIQERERLRTEGNTHLKEDNTLNLYGEDLIAEVYKFSEKVKTIIEEEDFDVIHAHDWTTFPAAIDASKMSSKPFIAHVHITEFDKSGGNGCDPHIYDIEKEGLEYADKVVAISHRVKEGLVRNYGIDPNKIEVIHHAKIEVGEDLHNIKRINDKDKIVLYAGRMTLQKGPEYFIEAARKVTEFYPNVLFIMIGTGDQLSQMIKRSVELGLQDKFLFHGFYTRDDANKFFTLADVFVMPSVSEPFGVVPFEAMTKHTPAVISKQSGCSEIIQNTMKVDFWDVDEMANQIVSILKHQSLSDTLKENGKAEVEGLTWDEPARRVVDIYKDLHKRRKK